MNVHNINKEIPENWFEHWVAGDFASFDCFAQDDQAN
jgi:hypothetical protein